MAFSRKSKNVSIRLSADEYELVVGKCIAGGARSVSDYARTALLKDDTELSLSVKKLHDEVQDLSLKLLNLWDHIGSSHRSPAANGNSAQPSPKK